MAAMSTTTADWVTIAHYEHTSGCLHPNAAARA